MTTKGIDVASFQSSTPGTSGLSFGFTKATQGTGYVNPRMASQAATFRKAGLVVGFYHFLVTGNIAAQAAYFVKHAAPKAGDVLAADWETDPATGHHATNAEKDAFIKAVQKLAPKNKVVLYCNLSFWKGIDTTSFYGDGLWIADPNAAAGHPRVTSAWVFHQYGISGTDVDVANFASLAALKAWAGGTVTPTPKPTPATKPVVDVSNLVAAYKADPKAAQGHTTHPNDVKPFEAALKKLGYLSSKYANDGSYGTTTETAFHAFRVAYSKKHKLGWNDAACSGAPGLQSVKGLATESGLFTAKA
jgi:GH25 family lysozyme M1 (1,4-beta-N-acetylmuramidase)